MGIQQLWLSAAWSGGRGCFGQSYYDYVREHIYKIAGMTSSDSLLERTPVPRRSVGYTKSGGGTLRPNTDTLPPRGTSAGGGYSTVKDLLAFANALLTHKLLDAHYTEILTSGKVDAEWGGKYAYGFMEDRNSGAMVRSRWWSPGDEWHAAHLSDFRLDPPSAQGIADFIGDRLPPK